MRCNAGSHPLVQPNPTRQSSRILCLSRQRHKSNILNPDDSGFQAPVSHMRACILCWAATPHEPPDAYCALAGLRWLEMARDGLRWLRRGRSYAILMMPTCTAGIALGIANKLLWILLGDTPSEAAITESGECKHQILFPLLSLAGWVCLRIRGCG